MKRKKIIMVLVILIGIISLPQTTKAVLQANPNTNGNKKDTPTNWMINIRKMETANQAMGLSETINSTTKKATSESNNIDVHMIKTTEWGAVAILSASGYGNPGKMQNSTIKSTTANKTGVYIPLAWEWTAGGVSGVVFSGVDKKYYDAYTTSNTEVKVGDALGTGSTANPGCRNWHSASGAGWVNSSCPYFARGGSGLFSTPINGSGSHLGRSAVVCGEGI